MFIRRLVMLLSPPVAPHCIGWNLLDTLSSSPPALWTRGPRLDVAAEHLQPSSGATDGAAAPILVHEEGSGRAVHGPCSGGGLHCGQAAARAAAAATTSAPPPTLSDPRRGNPVRPRPPLVSAAAFPQPNPSSAHPVLLLPDLPTGRHRRLAYAMAGGRDLHGGWVEAPRMR